MTALSSWGRLGHWHHQTIQLVDRAQAAKQISQGANGVLGVPHGMGRSYGDVCLNPGGSAWLTTALDRFIRFDPTSGRLHCDSGVLLADVQRLALRHGWMLPVTPGTQYVTVGGAIANDVHGKNHHRLGSFGQHIARLRLARTDGTVICCGPQERSEWFQATVAGAGLTGVILDAELQLRLVAGPWLDTESVAFTSLSDFFQLADDSEAAWEYTVAWIDCLSGASARGIFMRANHSASSAPAPAARPARSVPFVPPVSLVNSLSLRLFNEAYFQRHRAKAGPAPAHYQTFFYPLDHLQHWNRIYGPRGFYQYQSVVPRAVAFDAINAMLKAIGASGEGSFLAVLKTFGESRSPGLLSFPMQGATLALDFPNHGPRSHRLFERLDAIVAEAGGRIYLAKDARMPAALFRAGYPGLQEFQAFRDPGISSALSQRLMEN